MFKGVDDIDWDDVDYAYGTATDVPELLRAAADGDAESLDSLVGHIWHAYDLPGYEALARTLPFLVELLDVSTINRVGLLKLLSEIGERRLSPDFEDDHESPEVWWDVARQAVIAGAPTYARLLIDDDAADEDVRAWAAYLLGVSVSRGSSAIPVMVRASREDASPLVRASLILAVEATSTPIAPLAEGWLADPDPLPRLAGALVAPSTPAAMARRDLSTSAQTLARLPQAHGDAANFLSERLHGQWELQVSLLEALLGHKDYETRWRAVYAAERSIMAWRPALPRLVPLLTRNLYVGDRLATLLGNDQSAGWERLHRAHPVETWVTKLLAVAGGADMTVADDLWLLVDRLRESDRDNPDPRNTGFVLAALCRLRDARVGSYVTEQLVSTEPNWLLLDWHVLRLLGPWAAAGCRQSLLHHVTTAADGDLRLRVVEALGRISTADDADIADVVTALRTHVGSPVMISLQGRRGPRPGTITRILGDIGPAAAAAEPDVRQLLDHPEPGVRIEAARAIYQICGDASAAVPVLQTGIELENPLAALSALADLGPAGVKLAEPLRTHMAADDAMRATQAAIAFWRVTRDPEPAVPVLVRHLEGGNLGISAGAEPDTPPLDSDLHADSLSAEKAAIRVDALRCLTAIGPAAAEALPMLRRSTTTQARQIWSGSVDAVAEDDAWVRACAEALAGISG